jgi:hypothetical protein
VTTALWFPIVNEADAEIGKRFQRYVVKHDEDGACWTYTGYIGRNGYGYFNIKRKTVTAHRTAFALANGYATNLCVLHSCDNRRCVNPSHLSAGTIADNQRQMVERNRHSKKRDENSGMPKLTRELVLEILSGFASGRSQVKLARDYGMSESQIGRIVRRECWKEVTA